ncbi:MAG: GTPase domain-containing protein [Candidatus Moduliflexus flocculans]|nr:GTPase domain-containing protein [Candidatus Moduliflexus flocculans]
MSLLDAPHGTPLRIVDLAGGESVRPPPDGPGLPQGRRRRARRPGHPRGPLLVRNCTSDTTVALGRGRRPEGPGRGASMSRPEVPAVIFIGQPNSGKSTLFNSIAGQQGRDVELPRHVHQAHPQPGRHRRAASRRRRPARDLLALLGRPGRAGRPDPPVRGEARPRRQRRRRLDPEPRPRADARAGRARLSDGRRPQHGRRGRNARASRSTPPGSSAGSASPVVADHRRPRPRRPASFWTGPSKSSTRANPSEPLRFSDDVESRGRRPSSAACRPDSPSSPTPGSRPSSSSRRPGTPAAISSATWSPGLREDRRPGPEGHREGPRRARLRGHLGGAAPPGHEAGRGDQPRPPRQADDLGQEDRRRPHAPRARLCHPGRRPPGLLHHHLQGRQPARNAPPRAVQQAAGGPGGAAWASGLLFHLAEGLIQGVGGGVAIVLPYFLPLLLLMSALEDIGLPGPGRLPPRRLHAPDRPPRQVDLAVHPGLRLQRPGHRLDAHPRIAAGPGPDLAPHPLHPVLGPDDHRPGPGRLLPGPALGHGLLRGQHPRRRPRRLGRSAGS